jgi:hypothetical protein
MFRFLLLPIFTIVLSTAATAQTADTTVHAPAPKMRPEPIRVTVNVSVFAPSVNDSGAPAMQAQEAGRKMIYEVAGHECALLLSVLANECRLESVNINVQRFAPYQYGNQSGTEGFNINGNIGLRVLQK